LDKLDEQRKRAKSSRTEKVDGAFNQEFAKQVDLAIAIMETVSKRASKPIPK
jgi:hypothetical protein